MRQRWQASRERYTRRYAEGSSQDRRLLGAVAVLCGALAFGVELLISGLTDSRTSGWQLLHFGAEVAMLVAIAFTGYGLWLMATAEKR